jgi:hypothetical protein
MELPTIQNTIFEVRGHKIMLDRDLAKLYEVPVKSLNLAVKRNLERFPPDFMFRLTKEEFAALRFQNETSKRGANWLTFSIFYLKSISLWYILFRYEKFIFKTRRKSVYGN